MMFNRIYIHIPFCRSKCPYCSFVSREPENGELDDYLSLLLLEMTIAARQYPPSGHLDSIYLGGGTPSLLTPASVERIIERAAALFGCSSATEITIEANPGTVNPELLTGYRKCGVNRISLGVQSFNNAMLAMLGRIHTSTQTEDAFDAARQAGFDNIGIDLIHSLPGQTLEMWRRDLERAVSMSPEHLSIYGLTIEEGTRFASRYPDGSPEMPDDEISAGMFELADDFLGAAGYEHYEIANYSRPGNRSRHNCGYWKRDGYLGLGIGAHSYIKSGECGERYANTADAADYKAFLGRGELPRSEACRLSISDARSEYMFLGLRMADGITDADFEEKFGSSLVTVYPGVIEKLIRNGLLCITGNRIHLTLQGMLLSNRVFGCFLT